ncbi:alpha/beta hydrolase [Gordonia terrae]
MALDTPTQNLLAAMLESIPADAPPLWEMPVEQARAVAISGRAMLGRGPEMYAVEELNLESEDNAPFRVRILQPSASPTATVVFFHGGGWVLEDIDGYDTLGRELAHRSGAEVVLVDYRKAPENPFPAATDDAWSAVQWAGERLADAGRPLIVMGDSAGANLATGAAIRARDAGSPEVAGQVLVVPAVDSDTTRPSFHDPANQTTLSSPLMEWFWSLYVPDENRRTDPLVAPLHAPNLAELPPSLVFTAEHDILRPEGEEYVARLTEAGVTVEHRHLLGQMHTFFGLINVLPASSQTVDAIAEWVRETAQRAIER